jgi:hypothetical protein
MDNPATSSLHLGHRDAYGTNVSGGSDQVRFFISGDAQEELGPTHMPAFAQTTLDSMGVSLRDEWVNPEQLQTENFRTNMSAAFSPKFDFNANAGWSNTNQRVPETDNNIFSFMYNALNNPGFNHNGLGYNETGSLGENKNGYGNYSPAQIFQFLETNATQRFIGSSDATWRPFDWMQNTGQAGLDFADDNGFGLCRYNECANSGVTRQGQVNESQTNYRNFSAKLVSNSTWQARSNLNFKSTVGADYNNLEQDGVSANGSNLPPGAQNVGQAAVKSGSNTLQTVNKTLGLYVQEQASFRDRFFLTGAVRTDQNSSFGTQFQRVVYPKASLSWILSDESFFPHPTWLDQFRLRSAYGASGVQPGGTVSLQTFNSSTANIGNTPGSATSTDTPGILAAALGNPDLKPERSAEWENGFEMNMLNNRAHFDFTYYNKTTHDALVALPIAASSGASTLSVEENEGSVQNTGIEVNLNTTLIDRRALGWDVTISGSHNTNKILSLGNTLAGTPTPTIGTGGTRDSVGLPVNGVFVNPYTWSDANGDGIITPNEVSITPTNAPGTAAGFIYGGYSLPRDILSITNGFDLFQRRLRLSAEADYKGGYDLFNSTDQFYTANFSTWYSQNLASTPLWDQARTVANSSAAANTAAHINATSAGYYENGQFWRLREFSAAWTLPTAVAQRIRARDAQIVFEARNLHVWTKYTGVDPEENYSTGDVQTDFSTLAPRKYFILRANLHY